jgi:MSHA type pilus biogenesis protein MshL
MFFRRSGKCYKVTLLFSVMLQLSSCYPIANWTHGLSDKIDPEANLSRSEFKRELLRTPKNDKQKKDTANKAASGVSDENNTDEGTAEDPKAVPEIPEYSEILAAPQAAHTSSEKLVSLTVTEDIPVKDVLIELARLADVDMEIDPGITGGIIFRVKDKPFKDVIKNVCDLAGLRYRNENGILRVERDTPYMVNYKVDFLNMVRSSSSNVSIDTKVLGNAGNSANNSTGASNAANRTATGTNRTNQTATTNNNSSNNSQGLSSGSTNSITATYEGDLWTAIESTIQSILAFKPSNLSAQIAGDAVAPVTTTSYNINKQAGIISALATDKQHRNISEYLDSVRRTASAQVLIEAKIVEVTLSEEYKSGIDWATLANKGPGVQLTGNFITGLDTETSDFIKVGRLTKANSLSTSVGLMDTFGVTRTLSSPRLHAINNQQAVLTFAENQVYFTLQVEEQKDNATDGQTTLTVNSILNSVPIGVILTLQPSINLDTQEITMNVRPTLSRVTASVSDPGVDIIVARNKAEDDTAAPIKSEIPVVEVRELDSILKIKSGEVMVIGGLMKEVNNNTDKGVPGASRVPMFGNLFKSVHKKNDLVETVIFIKATIVPSSNTVNETDQHIYKTFTHDPRPLAF